MGQNCYKSCCDLPKCCAITCGSWDYDHLADKVESYLRHGGGEVFTSNQMRWIHDDPAILASYQRAQAKIQAIRNARVRKVERERRAREVKHQAAMLKQELMRKQAELELAVMNLRIQEINQAKAMHDAQSGAGAPYQAAPARQEIMPSAPSQEGQPPAATGSRSLSGLRRENYPPAYR